MPGNSWYYLCVATWWPMDEEKCSDDARCAVCTTPVMAAYSVCQKFNNINHECLQKVSTYDHKLKKIALLASFIYVFNVYDT